MTIDDILAMSEDEILATPIGDLSECLLVARNRMHMAFAGFDEADSNLSALAAETVPESTGTAVDEVYDFEQVESELCCPTCGSADLVMRKGRWQCEPCEERIFQSGF